MSRRLLALVVGGMVLGLLVAAPILSGDDLPTLTPEAADGRIDVGPVGDVHENSHAQPIVIPDQQVALSWFDPRWDGALARFPGSLEWQEGEGLTAVRTVDPESGRPAPWCVSSGLFEVLPAGPSFNDLGERTDDAEGARGLERHPVLLVDGRVIIDTTRTLPGPPTEGRIGYRGARGPRCADG